MRKLAPVTKSTIQKMNQWIEWDKHKSRIVHLVMFDIDGTLVDSNDFDSECYYEAIQDVLNIQIKNMLWR